MGVGFCIIVPKNLADDVLDILERFGDRADVIGYVEKGVGVYIPDKKLSYV